MAKGWCRAVAALAAVAIWGWSSGAAAVETATVTKTGDIAPGTNGATFDRFFAPLVNGAGEVVFEGFLTIGGSVTAANERGIWVAGPDGFTLVARDGDVMPGAGDPVVSELTSFEINGAGAVALEGFIGPTCCGSTGIWLSRPTGLSLVAKTGDPAPGMAGASFDRLDLDALNGAGEVLFSSTSGIWLGSPGSVALVAKIGGRAPGAGGATFDFAFMGVFDLSDTGEVAFSADLSDGREAIWLGSPGKLSLVAATGDKAPGTGGATFINILYHELSGAGELVFVGFLSDGGAGIWRFGPNGLALAARDGVRLPGTGGAAPGRLCGGPPPGFGPCFFSADPNNAGELTFSAELDDGREGIWLHGPDGLSPVAVTGDAAPGIDGATIDRHFAPHVSGAGEVAFGSQLTIGGSVTTANDGAIWAGPPGDLRLILREGDPLEVAPGDVRVPSGFLRFFSFSEGGQIAIHLAFNDATQAIVLAPPEAPMVHLLSHRTIDSKWRKVPLPQDFSRPVVIAGPPSFENRAPGVVRLRRVRKRAFEARFQEWNYLNGRHPEETQDFIVLEKGRQRMADGSIWEAGTFNVSGNGNWTTESFKRRFSGTPKLFLTVQGFRDRTPVVVRARQVTKRGFEAALFEEEKLARGGHSKETVGYLAIFSETNRGTIAGGVNGTTFALKRPRVTHKFKTRLGQRIKLEEEKSKDRERRHVRERVSIMRLGRGYFAQQVTDNETDTTALRRR